MSLLCVRVACAAALVVVGLAGCGSGDVDVDVNVDVSVQAGFSRTWEALPPAPLSPRVDAVAVWTGTEALFLGGQVEYFCPPKTTCDMEPNPSRDGAAYNPEARTWRGVADAPTPLMGPAPAALVDGVVFAIAANRELLAYDVAEDRWTSHGRVLQDSYYAGAVATGDGRLVFAGPGPVGRFYDPRTREWSKVPAPPSPIGDGYRRYAATPAGLVLTGNAPSGLPETPSGGLTEGPSSLVDAAVLDLARGRWRELPMTEQMEAEMHWSGTRLVGATQLGGVDGDSRHRWGRTYTWGGLLDPTTGEWAPLPNAPKPRTGGWVFDAPGGRWTATSGWIYDDVEETWTRLPQPPGTPESPGVAVWAGDLLIAFGGGPALTDDGGVTDATNVAWSYRAN